MPIPSSPSGEYTYWANGEPVEAVARPSVAPREYTYWANGEPVVIIVSGQGGGSPPPAAPTSARARCWMLD